MASHSETEKKPIYKKWWFWVIVIIVIIAIGGAGASNQTTNTATSSAATENTSNEVTTTDNASDETENVSVTLAQYEQIEDGMTYDEVVAIFGGKEASSSESEVAGIKSEIMIWNGNGTFSAVTIGFTDGKVSSKSQTGLE